MSRLFTLTTLLALGLLLAGALAAPVAQAQTPATDTAAAATLSATEATTGTLQFTANGEDFIRQGFISKDGWAITFDEALVNLSDIVATQTAPPFDPDIEQPVTIQAEAALTGTYLIDLAAGDEDADPVFVDDLVAAAGRYNALSWQTTPATTGDMAGYSILLRGLAEKEGETLEFTIGLERGYQNMCGEFVGDARKGILQPGQTADVEMTFHFDHIFGDAELPADDSLNKLAPGFAPFAAAAQNGVIDTDLTTLLDTLPAAESQKLLDILPTLGHTGEGHCNYEPLGQLQFTANGEDFIRQGFISKDGWQINFDEVLVNLQNITAYQSSPPFEPGHSGGLLFDDAVQLPGPYVVDLAAGNEDADPVFVDEVSVRAGRYNALGWQMTPATEGDMAGYSLLMRGTAQKAGETVDFSIGLDTSYNNLCGEFVGDTRKGIVQAGQTADVEMTFHFDHIFGDGELPATDSLNELAPGFAPFASTAADGVIDTDLSALVETLPAAEAGKLVDILPTLGHTGEGHCIYNETGALAFTANGEDFIRQGFTSKDGWQVSFDRVLVNLENIAAYQTSPPYEPDINEGTIEAEYLVELPGPYVVDLAAGDEDAAPIFVDEVIAPTGRYNALGWQMTPAAEGEMAGYSLLMQGTAEKDDETVEFSIGVDEGYNNLCGEFVGDARKGILQPGSAADLEMTFHFDHIFGDGDLPADDSLNKLAPGFAPFASLAEDGVIDTDLSTLTESLTADQADMLIGILPTLGHTGEGHCYYGAQSVVAGGIGPKAGGMD